MHVSLDCWSVNFDDLLSCELAAYPPSMFSPDGQMKVSKSKSTLKRNMQVTVSERNCPEADTVIYDVSALLWVIGWPSDRVKLPCVCRCIPNICLHNTTSWECYLSVRQVL